MSTLSRVAELTAVAGPLTHNLYLNEPGLVLPEAEIQGRLMLPNEVEIVTVEGDRLRERHIEVAVDHLGRFATAKCLRDLRGAPHTGVADEEVVERHWMPTEGDDYRELVLVANEKALSHEMHWGERMTRRVQIENFMADRKRSYDITRRTDVGARQQVETITPTHSDGRTFLTTVRDRDGRGRLVREDFNRCTLAGEIDIIGSRQYRYDDQGQLFRIDTDGYPDGSRTPIVVIERPSATRVEVAGYDSLRQEADGRFAWRETRVYNDAGLPVLVSRLTPQPDGPPAIERIAAGYSSTSIHVPSADGQQPTPAART